MPPRLGNVNPAGGSWTPAAPELWAQLSGLQPLSRCRNIFFRSRHISLACSGYRSDECDHRTGSGIGETTMTTFTIDADHNITAYANAAEAKQGDVAGVIQFDSQTALAKL